MDGSELTLHISIQINQGPSYGQGLRLEESLTLPARSFMEMAAILAEFQKLADRFRKEERK